MKTKDIINLTESELKKRIQESKFDLLQSKIKKTLGQLENPMYIRTLRKDIARLSTILNSKIKERELASKNK